MATIKDVAKEAGLAVGTVSRVLNNRGYISEQTRKKVYDAMDKLDYQPNEAARTLSKKQSSIIVVIVPQIGHPYFSEFLEELEKLAQKKDYKIMVLNSEGIAEREESYLEFCKRNLVAGVILFFGLLDARKFKNLGVPVILIERHPKGEAISVECDNIQGGVLATEHLIEKGSRHLLYVGGTVEMNSQDDYREQGFRTVCDKENIPYDVIDYPLDGYRLPEDCSALEKAISKRPYIDGIFASNDLLASLIIKILNKQGKRVPEDVQVVGFDDVFFSRYFVPSITTIHQPIQEMSKLAIWTIEALRNGETVANRSILPVKLIERESTK